MSDFLQPDYRRDVVRFTYRDDNDEEQEIDLPGTRQVCGRCGGRGKHDHPAFANGITERDFAEDPDFRDEYFAGRYDVRCSECDGRNVVLVVARDSVEPEILAKLDRWLEEERRFQLESSAERRAMGYY